MDGMRREQGCSRFLIFAVPLDVRVTLHSQLSYSMASKHELGKQGEGIAAQYLQEIGYRILERNWRYKRAEVDIIAEDGRVLVFVEVKTRASERFGSPEAFVGVRKQAFLASAASFFCDQNGHAGDVRFDVVSVLFSGKDFHTTHLRDAFFPGLG